MIYDDTIPHTIVRKIGGTDGDMSTRSHIWINYDIRRKVRLDARVPSNLETIRFM